MATRVRGTRSCIAVVSAAAAAAAMLTFAPAEGQRAAAVGAPQYIELMTSAATTSQYVRYVDGDTATPDPQQGFASLSPWVLNSTPELVTVAATADPHLVLAGTACLNSSGEPIGTLPPVRATHYTQPPIGIFGALPMIGMTSYACSTGATPTIVPEDITALITPGETLGFTRGASTPLDFASLKLSINASSTSAVRVTAKRGAAVVGTIDVDIDVDCVDSTDWENADVLCATRVVPYFGALTARYLNLDFGGSFDSFDITATAGGLRLKGKHPSKLFLDGDASGGTIGGGTGNPSVSQPPTDTLPGFEVACADAASPPPEGPCGGKEVALTIARFLADLDDDGNVDQVLDVTPSGAVSELAFLTITVEWTAEDAPTGAIPLSGFDEDGIGTDDTDPAAWCSVDPPGVPGDAWCLDTFTSASVGASQIQVTETFRGTGDPRAFR